MRYSPRPIEEYSRKIDGKVYGPHTSEFLGRDSEAWNMAFLSYTYEKRPVHPDPQFTILVVNTVKTRLDTGELDRVDRLPAHLTVRSLLKMPAPQLVKVLHKEGLYQRLPMFKAYGQSWLDTIEKRSWLCSTYAEDGADPYEAIESTATAEEILRKIANRKP